MIYSNVRSLIYNAPLMVLPSKLEDVDAGLNIRLHVGSDSVEPVAEPQALASNGEHSYLTGFKAPSSVAVIPISGVLANNRGVMKTASEPMASYAGIRAQIQAAVADDTVDTVLFYANSPGGQADGCFDLSDEVAAIEKKTIAYVDGRAASACYSIIAGVDEIVMSRTGAVGSIGVIAMVPDQTAKDEKDGVKYSIVRSGSRKADLNPHEKHPQEALNALQGEIDAAATVFFTHVAESRGIEVEDVKAMEGGMFAGQAAIVAGLADRIMSQADLIKELSTPTSNQPFHVPPVGVSASTNSEDISMDKEDDKSLSDKPEDEVTLPAPEFSAADAASIATLCAAKGVPHLAARCISGALSGDALQAAVDDAVASLAECAEAGIAKEMSDKWLADGLTSTQIKANIWDEKKGSLTTGPKLTSKEGVLDVLNAIDESTPIDGTNDAEEVSENEAADHQAMWGNVRPTNFQRKNKS